MCVISDKVKFCTCVDGEIKNLPNYWILFRFNSNKNSFIMGSPIFFDDFLHNNYEANQQTFLKRLNEPDAFDQEILFEEKDRIKIVLNNLDENRLNKVIFSFSFEKGKWKTKKFDAFDIINHFDKYSFGKLE